MDNNRTNELLVEILKSLQRIELLLQNASHQSIDQAESSEEKSESFLDVMEILNIVSEIDSNLVRAGLCPKKTRWTRNYFLFKISFKLIGIPMAAKVITFHSYKGGTGKSFLSLNTAAYLSKVEHKKVIVLDYDFRAPTLVHKFKPNMNKIRFLNEFLEGKYSINEMIFDQTEFLQSKETEKFQFSVAYASPKSRDMQEMQMKTRQWQQKALTILMGGLLKIKNDYDVVIIDSSPGITYDSLNAMSSSDAVILVATPDMVDIQGTVDMSSEIYPSLVKFGAQPGLVLNKIPWEGKDDLYETKAILDKLKFEADLPVISQCPCYCDSSLLYNAILVKENQDHPLIKNVQEIVAHLNQIKPRE